MVLLTRQFSPSQNDLIKIVQKIFGQFRESDMILELWNEMCSSYENTNDICNACSAVDLWLGFIYWLVCRTPDIKIKRLSIHTFILRHSSLNIAKYTKNTNQFVWIYLVVHFIFRSLHEMLILRFMLLQGPTQSFMWYQTIYIRKSQQFQQSFKDTNLYLTQFTDQNLCLSFVDMCVARCAWFAFKSLILGLWRYTLPMA